MKAPKKEIRVDGYVARRRTARANFLGWRVIAPSGRSYFCRRLTAEEAVAYARQKEAEEAEVRG